MFKHLLKLSIAQWATVGGLRLGSAFKALSRVEQAAVEAHVRAEYDACSTSYVSRNAKSGPEGWQYRLCELIASDEKRVRAIMEAAQRKAAEAKQGFTLIEMSIVLVIIGLIVGGVLVGQDLIRAAGERAQITQIEKYNTAANTFFGKYGYLPGDIPAGPAAQFGFAARGTLPGEGDGDGTLECGGDAVGCANHSYSFGEPVMFWTDLGAAHLIDGSFTSATSTGPAPALTASQFAQYFPVAKAGYANSVMIKPAGDGFVGTGRMGGSTSYAVVQMTGTNSSDSNEIESTAGLTVKQAYDIDNKIDDGLPGSGNVGIEQNVVDAAANFSYPGNDPQTVTATPTTCFDNSGTSNTPLKYSLTQNGGGGVNCELLFLMKVGDQ